MQVRGYQLPSSAASRTEDQIDLCKLQFSKKGYASWMQFAASRQMQIRQDLVGFRFHVTLSTHLTTYRRSQVINILSTPKSAPFANLIRKS